MNLASVAELTRLSLTGIMLMELNLSGLLVLNNLHRSNETDSDLFVI